MQTNIAIIGGSGFIGTRLTKRLLEAVEERLEWSGLES